MASKEKDGEANDDKSGTTKAEGKDRGHNLRAGAFLCATAGIAALFGFGGALAAAKRTDPSAFDQGLTGELEKGGEAVPGSDNHHRHHRHHRQPIPNGNRSGNGHVSGKSVPRLQQDQARLHQSGAALATRALAYGTLYAVAGCAALFFAIWKLSGAEDLKDFRQKAGSILPVIPKNNPPQGRTEFSGINDFLQYLSDEDEKNKKEKAARELQGEKEE